MSTDRVFVCPKCKSLCLLEDWNEPKGKCQSCAKSNKYHARKEVVDGEKFDSQHEASIYRELLLLQRQGMIRNLERQVPFKLEVEGCLVGKYIADFRYICISSEEAITIDAKGVKTPVYKLKKKLMKAIYNVDIIEM
jgi:hypothetical protein